jgi:hypothetical protein
VAEVVEETAEFLGGAVDVVGVFVEQREEKFFPPFAVAGLTGWAAPAGQVLYGPVDFSRLIDAQLAEPVVHGLELGFATEDDAVQVADGVGGVVQGAVIAGRRQEEPRQGIQVLTTSTSLINRP